MPANDPATTEALRYLTTPVRNHFFYGKLLTDTSFQREHWYGRMHLSILNRLTIGYGVLSGLAPLLGPDGRLAFQAGAAIDPVGRLIVVPATTPAIDPRLATDDLGRPIGAPLESTVVTISLAYYECLAEPIPTLLDGCNPCDAYAPDVIRERYVLLVRAEAAPDQVANCPVPGLFTPLPDTETLPAIHPPLAQRVSAPATPVTGLVAIPLARVSLPAAGLPIDATMLDFTLARPIAHSNQQLFELITCLAEQVTSIRRRRILSITAGDGQRGAPGANLAGPVVVTVVNGDGKPVFDEQLTIAVRMGGGTVSTLASPPTQTLDLKTDIVGQVSFTWQLGPAPGPQVVEAILATGSRASCYAEAIAPPQIVALWPPRGVELRQATTPAWFDLWVQTPRLQITTTRPLSIDPAADLSGWVRVWHLPAAYQPGQPLGTVAVLAAQTLIVPAILGSPGTAIEISLSAADLPVGVAEARFLVQIRTDPAVPSPITDDGQPVDADFAGSGLPLDLLQAIWDTGACGDTAVRANAAAPTGVALPSGDGKAGGIFHSWFDVIQP